MNRKTKRAIRRAPRLQKQNEPIVITPFQTDTDIKKNLHCNACNMDFPSEERAAKHYDSDFHKTYQDLYCSICSTYTATRDLMWSHMKSVKHQNKMEELGLSLGMSSPFYQSLPKMVKDQMSYKTCHICSEDFPSIQCALVHYQGAKHKLVLGSYFKKMKQTQKQTEPLSLERKVEIKLQPEKPQENYYFCYLCQKFLSSKVSTDEHVLSYPHNDLMKIKSMLVKQGIMQEFWKIQNSTVYCQICKATTLDPAIFNSHFNCKRHFNHFSDWSLQCKKNYSDPNAKWFYCKPCDKDLDGTSRADRHYSFNNHIKKMKLYCLECDVLNDMEDSLELHKTSDVHLKKTGNFPDRVLVKEGVSENTHSAAKPSDVQMNKLLQNQSNLILAPRELDEFKNNIIEPKTSSTDFAFSKETTSLKETEFLAPRELIQFKNNITEPKTTSKDFAFSKESLKGTEFLAPRESSEFENNITEPKPSSKDSGFSKETTNLKEKVFNELDKLIQKLYYSKSVPYDIALQYLKKVNKEVDEMVKQNQKDVEIVSQEERPFFYPNYSLSNLNNTTSSASTNHLEFKDTNNYVKDLIAVDPPKSNNVDFKTVEETPTIKTNYDKKSEKMDGISDLLNKVVQTELECNQTEEKELLNEMMIFLKQIDKDQIPLEKLSDYLEKCNKELESLDFTEDKSTLDCEDKGPCLQLKYREENQTQQQIHEEPLQSKTVDTPKSASPELIDFEDNNDSEIEEGPISIYDNYNGVELDPLMDFCEPHSQGSLDNCDKYNQNKPKRAYTREELLQLRTPETFKQVAPQLKEKLDEADIWNRNFNDKKLKKADGCPRSSIYSFYGGDGFECFMDFYEVYTQGSLNSLRKYNQKPKRAYTREELLQLRTPDTFKQVTPQLKEKLDEADIWNRNFNGKKLKKADGCPRSIYSFYGGDGFECFMDFYEVYTQGSLNSLRKDNQKPKRAYTREELLQLWTADTFKQVAPQLKEKLDEADIWNQNFNDKKLKKADGCPKSIYSFYGGDGFESFMNFYEVYTQGSLNSLKK